MALSPLPIPKAAGDTYLTRRANTTERASKGGSRPVLTRARGGRRAQWTERDETPPRGVTWRSAGTTPSWRWCQPARPLPTGPGLDSTGAIHELKVADHCKRLIA